LIKGNLPREAAIEYNRVRELTPEKLDAHLWFAKICGILGHPDRSLEVVKELKENSDDYPGLDEKQAQLVFLEAAAHLSMQDTNAVVELISTELGAEEPNADLLALGAQVYLQAGLLTNALELVLRQQELTPREVTPYVSAAFLKIRMELYDEAVAFLDQAIELQPANGTARFYRAFALLQGGAQEEAEQAYRKLQIDFPNAHQVYHGLGEIAWQRNDTNRAIHNYRLYLSNAPPNSAETALVHERLNLLSGSTE
jgi:tetratricopeptide (TPR) repeat protein